MHPWILVPAAGNSSRLGQVKQLVPFRGEPLLQQRLAVFRATGCPVLCVLGHQAEVLAPLAAAQGAAVVLHDGWAEGIGSSIAHGVHHLEAATPAVLIVMADQWGLATADLQRLIAFWRQEPECIAAARYQDTVGVPAIFPRSYFAALQKLRHRGAKHLLQTGGGEVRLLDMPSAACDLDTPQQLADLVRQERA